MKKSLVITTIATVLVIVVALTTATFAWFSTGSETAVNSQFTAQTDASVFRMYKWQDTAYSTEANNLLDFGDVSYTSKTSQYAYWSTSGMQAFRPIKEIDTNTIVTTAQNDTIGGLGLPGAEFFTANTSGSTLINVAKVDYAKLGAPEMGGSLKSPNVARFQLENNQDTPIAVQVTVTITPAGSDNHVRMANAMKFLIIAKPIDSNGDGVSEAPDAGDSSAGDIGFVFGTEYGYGLQGYNFSSGDGTSDTTAIAGSVTGTSKNQAGKINYVTPINENEATPRTYNFIDPTTFASVSGSTTAYNSAKLEPGHSYAIYLYVWLDGTLASGSAAEGQVTFNIGFTGKELTA